MKIVADKLRDIALDSHVDHEIDQFGRSAFNRYYYAAYLEVRKNLMKINSGWAKAPHKNLPTILTTTLNKSAKNLVLRLNKKGTLDPHEGSRILTTIKTCTNELSQILQSGDEARIYADYVPEEIITRGINNFSLHNYTIRAAQSWPIRAEKCAGQLLSMWRQLG